MLESTGWLRKLDKISDSIQRHKTGIPLCNVKEQPGRRPIPNGESQTGRTRGENLAERHKQALETD